MTDHISWVVHFLHITRFRSIHLIKYVSYMAAHNRSVSSKQLCHLALIKPHGIILQLHFKLCVYVNRSLEHDR